MKKSSQLNRQGGFTLIELVVTMAIASLVLSIIGSIFTLTLKSYNQSTNMADAQNLATMTIRKIEQETRVCSSLKIYTTKIDSPPGTEIYFDDTKQGINIGNKTYLAGTFDKYNCKLDFKKSGSNLLGITVTIYDKNDKSGKTLSNISTSVYLENKPVIDDNDVGKDGGNVIVFS